MENKLTAPLSTLQWVDRSKLKANNWNPNKVSRENLDLLVQSILSNGWTLPIVCRPDFTIIDGFHRWTVAGEEPLKTKLGGKVPIVIVKHADEAGDVYGTVTHNRARGTHLLEPMKNIIKKLLAQGKTVKEIGKELGMKPEEVFRLSDLSKEHFLKLMAERSTGYSKELLLRKV
jgi:ParB-like chromosome segregation protein Spo0J